MPTKSAKTPKTAAKASKQRARTAANTVRSRKAPARKSATKPAPTRKAAAKKSATTKATVKHTGRKPAAKQATNTTRTRRPDAIALLKEDHREVQQLFRRFEKAGDSAEREKRRLVDAMTAALSRHAAIEERVLYPWARDTVKGVDDDVLEAFEEHRIVKWLLTELRSIEPGDERFDAKVTVMIELVRHHVDEEESDLFPALRRAASRAELLDLGDRLRTAKRVAPSVPDLGAGGTVGAAVEHARDVGQGVVERIGALTGVE